MKVVIQCAASKDHSAGTMRTKDGKVVLFVANPHIAPATSNQVFARPDDRADDGRRWRDHVLDYNFNSSRNPHGLLPAWRLYQPKCYRKLVERLGADNVFILSAGWGLIRADFLTPVYDITFSSQADPFKRRKARDQYDDFNMLGTRGNESVAYFGGKDYLRLYEALTQVYPGKRIVVFNSVHQPKTEGVEFARFETTTHTNWHYEAVDAFLNGTFSPISTQINSST